MDPVSSFRPALDADPLDGGKRLILADQLDDLSDPRAAILRSADVITRQIRDVVFPDRYPAFWADSPGWQPVAEQLDALAARPEDTDAFRARYERLVRGGVPLDPENLGQTLRLQYDVQVRRLHSLDLLDTGDDGERFITALDGNRSPVPAFDDVLAKLHAPELQRKLRQGFDTLLLVPFGLPLDKLLDAWRAGLTRNADALRRVGQFNDTNPLWAWHRITQDRLVYAPRSFSAAHGGRTKGQLVDAGRTWDVLLVEGALRNLPPDGEERTVGGRTQLPCGQTSEEYRVEQQSRRERGLTPEAYILASLDSLERRGQVLDTETYSFLTGAYLPGSRRVLSVRWSTWIGRMHIYDVDPGGADPRGGTRASVRVI